jgi:hypothetical protein
MPPTLAFVLLVLAARAIVLRAGDDRPVNSRPEGFRPPDWSSVAKWHAPRSRVAWHAAREWAATFERVVAVAGDRLVDAVERWDGRLADLGGDPAREDWSTFRPLRLSREEDWSDWLAHLLERSRSGRFPARLFSGDAQDADRWKVVRAHREVWAGDYRADLVVSFTRGEWAHVEVKVGDLALEKTPDTGAALRRQVPGTCRGDFLLLPEEDVALWETVAPALGGAGDQVEARTWHDAARALRLSIAEGDAEPLCWRVWALTFLGAVEQVLLGFPPVPSRATRGPYRPSPRDLARLEFLVSLESR